jgi:PAS domain S-box-containing protein
MVCRPAEGQLFVTYADPDFRAAVGLPGIGSVWDERLSSVLAGRLSAAAERELAASVVTRTEVSLALRSAEELDTVRLLLTPVPRHELWVGTLMRGTEADIRVESARLRPISASSPAPPARAPADDPFLFGVLDTTRALIAIHSDDNRYALVNSAMAEFHGLERDELIGREVSKLAGRVEVPLAWPITDTPLIARNVELTDALGHRRRFDIASHVVRAGDGARRYLIEVATELDAPEPAGPLSTLSRSALPTETERPPGDDARLALAALAETLSATEFRCALEPTLTVTYLDQTAERLFGVPVESLLGPIDRLLAYALNADPNEWAARWQQQAASGAPWEEELEVLDAHGELRWLKVVARPAGAGYVGFLADQSAIKRAESHGNELAEQLSAVSTYGEIALVDWHLDSDRLVANRELLKLLELDDPERVGTGSHLGSLTHPKDKARVHMALQSHLAAETPAFRCEYRVKTGRGRWRWVLAGGRAVKRGPDGRALRYVGILKDITESLETEQELERQLARAKESARVALALEGDVRRLEAETRDIGRREQERIGRDLHDGLGQELAGASLLLKSLEQAMEQDAPPLGPRVRSVRDLVEQCISTVRAIAQGLAPPELERDGLPGALKQLAARTEAVYGIPVRFSVQGRLPELGPAATDFYRIAQEAVVNAAKHAEATKIDVELGSGPDGLTLCVTDDGSGLTSGLHLRGGMGLQIMRHRASIIGASLDIRARDGGGTVVRCALRPRPEGALLRGS